MLIRHSSNALVLRQLASGSHPAYDMIVSVAPYSIRVVSGGRVLETDAAQTLQLASGGNQYVATTVTSHIAKGQTLQWSVGSTLPGDTFACDATASPGLIRLRCRVIGHQPVTGITTSYLLWPSGHWYGQGELDSGYTYVPGVGALANGEEYQPWALDQGAFADYHHGPFSEYFEEPYWFTSSSYGIWVATTRDMDSWMNYWPKGDLRFAVLGSRVMSQRILVEKSPLAVYRDHLKIVGHPTRTTTPFREFERPLWNTHAEFAHGRSTQAETLAYAKALKENRMAAATVQVDSGWQAHYGDFSFDPARFPIPRAMTEKLHAMGYKFGLWATLFINPDASVYSTAVKAGYVLRAANGNGPCQVPWWHGTGALLDVANPEARAWFASRLEHFMRRYGIDGFKFDTLFFDSSCAPRQGTTVNDYQRMAARLLGKYDLQGAGLRLHWNAQRYGFLVRGEDKFSTWPALSATITQALTMSSMGYPFVSTNAIGGTSSYSTGVYPAADLLVRWAQAAALTPLMVAQVLPLASGRGNYPSWVSTDFQSAVRLHERLAPYIWRQVGVALKTGLPIMRPLFFDYPSEIASYTDSTEWMLGDAVLAAPVVTDSRQRSISIPRGRWCDANTGQVVMGPVLLSSYQSGMSEAPFFVRLGMRDSESAMAAAPHRCLST
ncbi:MAG TPA: glycoside hydrolase family 31 protein [Chloroflexota bacterium]|nr:glycoside hydrolase family 31 protein [Chloroflexota bacterium]